MGIIELKVNARVAVAYSTEEENSIILIPA